MKSLRWRLVAWFSISVVLILTVFTGFTYYYLRSELHKKNWQRDYPNHPDWKLHGSYSEAEVADIMEELIEISLLYGIPLAVVAVIIGFALANKSLRPIANLNEQLQTIRAPDLSRRIELPEVDAEFRGLVKHINELLGRVDHAITLVPFCAGHASAHDTVGVCRTMARAGARAPRLEADGSPMVSLEGLAPRRRQRHGEPSTRSIYSLSHRKGAWFSVQERFRDFIGGESPGPNQQASSTA